MLNYTAALISHKVLSGRCDYSPLVVIVVVAVYLSVLSFWSAKLILNHVLWPNLMFSHNAATSQYFGELHVRYEKC